MASKFYPDPRLGKFALAVDKKGFLWRVSWMDTPSELTRIIDSAVYHPGTGSLLSIFWHLQLWDGGEHDSGENIV